jgi:hypothetical protein
MRSKSSEFLPNPPQFSCQFTGFAAKSLRINYDNERYCIRGRIVFISFRSVAHTNVMVPAGARRVGSMVDLWRASLIRDEGSDLEGALHQAYNHALRYELWDVADDLQRIIRGMQIRDAVRITGTPQNGRGKIRRRQGN